MKKISAILAAAMLSASLPLNAGAASDASASFFLCMQGDSSIAYISEDGQMGDYRTMVSSNGATVKALIIDGSTYLPFRFLSELAGWQEGDMEVTVKATPIPGTVNVGMTVNSTTKKEANKNVFKFVMDGDSQKLQMRGTGSIFERVVGQDFDYAIKVDGKSETRTFCIKNIDGSLYMPLRYMADILGAKADYDSKTGNIYFAGNAQIMNTFVDNNKTFKFEKTVSGTYKLYDNMLMYSEEYLTSSGKTTSTVSAELGEKARSYSCVSRSFDNLYFLNESDYRVYTKKENEGKTHKIDFYNKSNGVEDFAVDVVFTDGEKLWGSQLDTGRIFCADMNGRNLEYIADTDGAYNLLYREYENKGYIFYMKSDRTTLMRLDPQTLVSTEVSIRDVSGNNSLYNVGIITLGKDSVIYKNAGTGVLHYVPLFGNMYTDSYIQAGNMRLADRYNGKVLGEVQSMNYDDENGILFFTCLTSDGIAGDGLYYYDTISSQLGCLRTSSEIKSRISIIKKGYDVYGVGFSGDNRVEEIQVKIILGRINIDGNITLNR